MKDEYKTKKQLTSELVELRRQVAELEASGTERKRAEEALRERESFLQTIIDNEPECVKLLAMDGSLLQMNRAGLDMIEADTFEQVRGWPVSLLVAKEYREAFEAVTEKVFRGESSQLEFEIVGLKGTRRWLNTHAVPLRNQKDEITAVLGITRDITECKRAEEAMQESENKFRTLAEESPNMIFINKGGHVVYANKRCEEIMGYTKKEFYTEDFDFMELIAPESRYLVKKNLRKHMRGEEVQPHEYKIWTRDGKEISAIHATRLIDFEGDKAILGIVTDITEQKRAEETIQHNYDTQTVLTSLLRLSLEKISLEELLMRTVDIILSIPWLSFESKGGIFLVEGNTDVLILKAQKGLSKQIQKECTQLPFGRCLCGQAASKQEIQFADCLDDRHEILYKGIPDHGHYCAPILLGNSTLGVINIYLREGHHQNPKEKEFLTAVSNTLAGIIQRKQTEEALKARSRQQEVVAALGQYALAGIDLETLLNETTTLVAQTLDVEYCKVLELLPDGKALLLRSGVGWKDGLVGNTTVDADTNSQAGYTLLSSEPVIVEDLRTEKRFGGPQLLRNHDVISGMSVVIGDIKRPFGVLGAHTTKQQRFTSDAIHFLQSVANILAETIERKQAEDQRKKLISTLNTLMDHLPEGVVLLNAEKRVILVNPVGKEYLNTLSKAGIGDLLRHIGNHPVEELLGSPPQITWHNIEIIGQPRRIFEIAGSAIGTDKTPGGIVFVIKDVTENRALQDHLQSQERLAAVGHLAAGIAHDFNNILTGIMGYAEMLYTDSILSDEDRQMVDAILQNSQRATELIHQILDFSRKSRSEMKPIDLMSLLQKFSEFIRRTFPENIELSVDCRPGEYIVWADPAKMQQVFANLALNARDAIPDGGKLTFALSRINIKPEDNPLIPDMSAGDWISLSISDSGTGIDSEVSQHIFEPFFTTKDVDKGTGLGLSQVYGIVKQHKGHIRLETEIGKGSTFIIYLPESRKKVEITPVKGEVFQTKGQNETILIVEDNEGVRKLLQGKLSKLDYKVITATNGKEALRIFKNRQDEINLVITDLVMPIMGGIELSRVLKSMDPSIKVIAVSGYPLGLDKKDLLKAGIEECIQKPFQRQKLLEVLRRVLEKTDLDS